MQLLKTLSRAAGLGLCVVAFTGSALADPGKGNGAPESTPPGQEQKAETPAATPGPAPQAAHGQEQKAENKPAAPAPAPAAKASSPGQQKKAANQQKQAAKKQAQAAKKAATTADHSGSGSKGRSAEAHHHVIVCHATGSASNPYVVINIPWTAWTEGHSRHGDRTDKLLKDPASRPGSKDGFTKAACGEQSSTSTTQNQSSQQSTTTTCPATVTTTERVLVGIKHYTGAVKNGQRQFVVISPSEKSAHLNGKHADDAAIYETRTVTRSFSGENCAAVVSTNTTSTTSPTTSPTSPTTNAAAVASTEAVGGVAGAVSPAPTSGKKAAKKPAGGVLGAVASAPEAIASTASGDLPFTGIPLWIAALIGMALVAAGLTLRRSA